MDLGLTGKVAIVTGASRGIGLACARQLAREGCRVLLVARGAEALQAAAREIPGAAIFAADVTRDEAADEMVAAALQNFGRLDVILANAGGGAGPREFDATSAADWERTFRLNVVHATNLLRAAAPQLEAGGQGAAIFVASISGRTAQGPNAQYASVKAALIHAARSLAWEYAPRRIRVNALSPGSILFEGGNWERRKNTQAHEFAAFEKSEFPWGRLGTPEEIADVAAFLASPRSRWINASDVQVDGGQRRPAM